MIRSRATPNSAHVSGAGTSVVYTGTGTVGTGATLKYVTVNNAGGTGATLTVYDNTAASGKVICVIDTSFAAVAGTYFYDTPIRNGITVVTVGALSDATIVWEPA